MQDFAEILSDFFFSHLSSLPSCFYLRFSLLFNSIFPSWYKFSLLKPDIVLYILRVVLVLYISDLLQSQLKPLFRYMILMKY